MSEENSPALARFQAVVTTILRAGPTNVVFLAEVAPPQEMVEAWRQKRKGLSPLRMGFESVGRAVMARSRIPHRGCVDFKGRRYFLEAGRGSYCRYYLDGLTYTGKREQLSPGPQPRSEASPTFEPLWLVELLLGATDMTERQDNEGPAGFQRFLLSCDLMRASSRSAHGMGVPQAQSFEELSRIPAEVHISEGGEIRRISLTHGLARRSLELSELGRASEDCFPSPQFRPVPSADE